MLAITHFLALRSRERCERKFILIATSNLTLSVGGPPRWLPVEKQQQRVNDPEIHTSMMDSDDNRLDSLSLGSIFVVSSLIVQLISLDSIELRLHWWKQLRNGNWSCRLSFPSARLLLRWSHRVEWKRFQCPARRQKRPEEKNNQSR